MTKRAIAAFVALAAAVLTAGLALATSADAQPYPSSGPPPPPQQSVTVSTTNPPVGGTITISGTGFAANHTLVITLHTKTYTLGTTTTDASGSYSVTVKLPAGVSGKHTITVEDPATHKKAKIRITIGSAHGAAGAATSDGSSGGLSSTGVAVMGIGALGVVLLVGGGLMMLAGRRRKVAA